MKKYLIIILFAITLCGCTTEIPNINNEEEKEETLLPEEETTVPESDIYEVFSNRDYNEEIYYSIDDNEYDEVDLSNITSKYNLVSINDNVVTITTKGSYIFTGETTSAKIVIDTTDKVQIILNDVSMTSQNDTLIHMIESDKTFIRLDGNNTLITNMKEEFDGVDGAIFAKDNLSINGTGSLTINSNLNGIVAKDDLTITNGTFNITSICNAIEVNEELAITNATFNIETNGGQSTAPYQESEESNFGPGSRPWTSTDLTWSCKAFKCDEFIYIKDGIFNIDSYDDAFHCDETIIINGGTFDIKSGDDAIHANIELKINGGDIDINYCYEGLEAQRITINNGNINIDSYDDGINSAKNSDNGDDLGTFININGGSVIITIIEISKSPEADGLDSNGDILITGGYILIHGTTNTKDTPLDYDGSGTITGGTFLTGGSYSMTDQNFGSASTQCSIYYNLNTQTTGVVTLKDSSGNVVVTYTLINQFQIVHISTPDLKIGETYTLVVNNKSYTIKMTSNIYGTPSH